MSILKERHFKWHFSPWFDVLKPSCIQLQFPVRHVLSSLCTSRTQEIAAEYELGSISLHTHDSVLDEHTKVLKVPL